MRLYVSSEEFNSDSLLASIGIVGPSLTVQHVRSEKKYIRIKDEQREKTMIGIDIRFLKDFGIIPPRSHQTMIVLIRRVKIMVDDNVL